MMSLEHIEAESRKAARRSAREGLTPLVVWKPDEVYGAPFLGTRVPKGWRVLTYTDLHLKPGDGGKGWFGNNRLGVMLFADSSGMGADDEPALSTSQLETAIKRLHDTRPDLTLGFGIYEVGQFQVHIRAFVKNDTVARARN